MRQYSTKQRTSRDAAYICDVDEVVFSERFNERPDGVLHQCERLSVATATPTLNTRSSHFTYVQSGQKSKLLYCGLYITSSIMDQFKEIPLLESLLNFQQDACNICHIPSKCYTTLPCKMANNVRAHLEFCKSLGQTQ